MPGPADVANNDVETELEDIKIVVLLKGLSNFMFNLNFLLNNAEIELILKWTLDCVLTGKATKEAKAEGDDSATDPAVGAADRPKYLNLTLLTVNCMFL